MGVLSENAGRRIQAYAARYPEPRSALLPALHVAQNELGWLSREAMEEVGTLLGVARDQVEEVATFYSMFYKQRVGRYVLEICKTAPCSFLGADEVIDYACGKLGVQPGETTEDGMFTLLRVECLGACHRAPVMQVNHRYYQDLTPDKIDALIEAAHKQAIQAAGDSKFAIVPDWPEVLSHE